ncbi:hypothetical protein CE91St62_18820 [Lachnospiraceae bacterium]|uniref:zf-HC2 domain-containing protein n=1 Tax=Extibacter sp. GGCC_0201 TaxID=2731209 RepID=UPI001AA191EB|nr:zf-HC2 domain-containing protein [Extibacter sp. GGCC_0201]MBO1719688.1 zf-HC2 domain-containing protein [Extibacter sp. GGCC_0201]BDF33816.1 hypothetical protein CE91St61_18910 [Lachnospiraceae bacterium]BDF37821.1 hypothetical protein CE91St62_18820 [Lachnospiraceae bacterium]
MTNCNIIQDLLPLYLDDACSKESRELVEEHLAQCAICRKQKMMMEQGIEFEEDFMAQNLKEEKLLEEGKKYIEQKAKKDILVKAAYVDVVLNILSIVLTAMYIRKIAGEGLLMEYMFSYGPLLPAVLIMFLVAEYVFLVRDRTNKETFVSQMMAAASILLKAACLVIAGIIGIAILVAGI